MAVVIVDLGSNETRLLHIFLKIELNPQGRAAYVVVTVSLKGHGFLLTKSEENIPFRPEVMHYSWCLACVHVFLSSAAAATGVTEKS